MIRSTLLFLTTVVAIPPTNETSVPRGCNGRGVSGPIVVTTDGQIVENLVVRSTAGPAIRVTGARGVVLRNLTVFHEGDAGIAILHAPGARIETVDVFNTGAPQRGPAKTADEINIQCEGSPDLIVRNARLQLGSSGIYLLECDRSTLTGIEGRDFRGPFPRGQLVQWDKARGGTLSDFSAFNSIARSWPEDIVNIYQSSGITVSRGVVDGNNSVSGDGVIVDEKSHDVAIRDVDARRQMNGCFGVYGGGSYNVTMLRTRCSDTICRSHRGKPL